MRSISVRAFSGAVAAWVDRLGTRNQAFSLMVTLPSFGYPPLNFGAAIICAKSQEVQRGPFVKM